MIIKGLFHIHSKYSYDSYISPKKIVDFAVKHNISIIAVTDHNTIEGSIKTEKNASHYSENLKIIIGAEYTTDKGDLIGLFLKDEIVSRSADEVLKEIKRQGGLSLLPHPYKNKNIDEDFARHCDLIEIFNSRLTVKQNTMGLDLARKMNKPGLAGSDAHLYNELGLTTVIFESEFGDIKEMLIEGKRRLITGYSNRNNILKSQLIKSIKNRNIKGIYSFSKLLMTTNIKRDN